MAARSVAGGRFDGILACGSIASSHAGEQLLDLLSRRLHDEFLPGSLKAGGTYRSDAASIVTRCFALRHGDARDDAVVVSL